LSEVLSGGVSGELLARPAVAREGREEKAMNDHRRDLAVRRASPRAFYILAVSGVLGIVTFTLVYLTTLALVTG
jgi:hypothetical protein